MSSMQGKGAWVTDGGSGIGRATATESIDAHSGRMNYALNYINVVNCCFVMHQEEAAPSAPAWV